MDQFASKVVEKCLKIGGADFLERYLERVCEGRPDRPRIPLIDSKQLLKSSLVLLFLHIDALCSRQRPVRQLSDSVHSDSRQPSSPRDRSFTYSVRILHCHCSLSGELTMNSKHMVSLRGSKFGSRVGMLCCNPAYATHPGPGAGLAPSRYASSGNQPSTRYSGAYR